MEDKTKFFKAWHKNQDQERETKGRRKKLHRRRIVTLLGAIAIPPPALFPCTSNETVISFFPL